MYRIIYEDLGPCDYYSCKVAVNRFGRLQCPKCGSRLDKTYAKRCLGDNAEEKFAGRAYVCKLVKAQKFELLDTHRVPVMGHNGEMRTFYVFYTLRRPKP